MPPVVTIAPAAEAVGAAEPGTEAAPAPSLEPEPVPEPDQATTAMADRLLAELAAAETILDRESGLGSLRLKLAGFGGSRGVVGLAVGAGTLLLVLGLLGLTLLGLLV